MARDLKGRGFASSYNPSNYNNNRFRSSFSGVGTNLRDRGYPSSFGANSGVTGLTNASSSRTGGRRTGRSGVGAAGRLSFKSNPWDDYYNKRKSMAQAAYDKSMGALNEAYGAYMAAMQDNLNSAKGALEDSYNRSKENIVADATASLKQAYINKMLSAKNFDQQMTAQGLSGGASETTRAAMSNNYGNARNDINAQKARNLSELEGQYNDNLAQAMQAYNSAVAQAQLQKAMQAMDLENMLADGEIAALDDYYAMMDKYGGFDPSSYSAEFALLGEGLNGFEFDPTQANNKMAFPDVVQSQNMGVDQRTYANLLEALKNIMGQTPMKGISTSLGQTPQNNYLNALLAQLKGAR